MECRGVRGAITVAANTAEDILEGTTELLQGLIAANDIEPEKVASVIFSTTPDLNATFPALAARELGWHDVALLCTHEMAVPGALGKVVRVLLHLNTERAAHEIVHLWLGDAWKLRPDLFNSEEEARAVLTADRVASR